jgi:predicted DNA-binding antitoxin AbrB/MazE fold protein
MSDTITAVVQDGVLKPRQPLDLPEGREVELQIIRLLPTSEEEPVPARDLQHLSRTLARIREEAAKFPAEWWDDFEEELRQNRMNFEERV